MRFTIDRKRWARGSNHPSTRNTLLNADGTMCCLGFFLAACGLEDKELQEIGEPNEVARYFQEERSEGDWPKEANFLVVFADGDPTGYDDNPHTIGTKAETDLIDANDDESLTEAQREERIYQLFAAHGHEVDFRG